VKIKDTERHILISDTEFKDFSKSIFEDISSKYDKKTIVLHGEALSQNLEIIRDNFRDNYFVQLGFTASKGDIVKVQKTESEKLTAKVYKNSSEALNDIKSTYATGSDEDWFQYIPEPIHKENINYLEKELSLSRILTLVDSSNVINAMVMSFDSLFYTDESVDQIGWVWVKRDITKNSRLEAHSKILNWLRVNLTKDFYQAGVHIENSRSQIFFQKMGFKLKCAHITKK
jgi:hypothetical protein